MAKNRSRIGTGKGTGKGRKKELKSNKPSKEVLEKDLRAGLPIAAIAKKHESAVQNVHNWIKSYGLAGIQGQKKPISEKQTSAGDDFDIVADQVRRAKELITESILEKTAQGSPTLAEIELDELEIAKDQKFYDDLKAGYANMTQESPTLAEIEQFHTDVAVPELPKVEMDQVLVIDAALGVDPIRGIDPTLGIDMSKVENSFADAAPIELPKVEMNEPINIPVETAAAAEERAWQDKEFELREVTPAPLETVDEIWQDVYADLTTLEKIYVAEARKSFRGRLRGMVTDVIGGKE